MNDLVSIVVPIYNVELYLEKCIESIINQTYKNIEIILVNDGSTDNCLEICKQYCAKDGRIIIVDKRNGGLSDARNAGIKKASGKYIAFIDSDDYIEHTMIERLYLNAISTNADICICNFYNTVDGKDGRNKCNNRYIIDNDGKNLYEELYGNEPNQTIVSWNKIYKIDLFNDCQYPVGLIHEDQYIICDLLAKCKRVSYITDEYLYHYVDRKGSITKNFNIKRFDIVVGLDRRIELFRKKGFDDLVARTMLEKIQALHQLLDECRKTNNGIENNYKKYQEEYTRTIDTIDHSKLRIKSRIKLLLISKCPAIYDLLKKVKK